MADPIITAACPGNTGLVVTTIDDLTAREHEERAQRREVAEALNSMAKPGRLRVWAGRLRWRLRLPVLILALSACDAPLPLVDAGTDLAASDLAAPDAGPSPCDDLPGGACFLCEDDRKDCRPAAPPECLSCSWTEPLNCVPSACMEFRYGVKCCVAGRTS